jgi:hypothetical protein
MNSVASLSVSVSVKNFSQMMEERTVEKDDLTDHKPQTLNCMLITVCPFDDNTAVHGSQGTN